MLQSSDDDMTINRRYALCVGIGTYTHLSNRELHYAVADAIEIAKQLRDPQRGNFNVRVLTEPTQTTKAFLDEAVDQLLNASNRRHDDLVLLYFSCHGDVNKKDNTFFLMPSDATLQANETFEQTTVIDVSDLAKWFSSARTYNIVMLLDVCHSGGAGIALQRFNPHLEVGPNYFILGAARQDQVADQSSGLKHGVFTYCLLRAFEQPPTKGGWLTISQIQNFISEEIPWFAKDRPIQIQISSMSVDPQLPLLRNPGYPELCPLPPFWNVPFRRNIYFTEQDSLLSQLTSMVQTEQKMALTQPYALSGLGGIGKTQLALEYAYRHRQDYHAVLWSRADTREALISTFVTIAHLLDLPQKDEQDQMITVEAVKAWLAEHSKWLLILDNADELAIVKEFIPLAFQGHLLLTTRAQVMGELARKFEVEVMRPEIGALLLLRRAHLIAPDAPLKLASPADVMVAKELSEEMGGLPLALDQAGAYIEAVSCSPRDYQQLYQTRQMELLKKRGSITLDYPQSVATTWSLAFQKVEQGNPTASDLLRLCAFLHPDAIPEEVIVKGAEYLGPQLQAARDQLVLNRAIIDLRAYSLLHRDSATHTLTIHRLVQAVLKEGLSEQTRHEWAERTIRAVDLSFPDATNVNLWGQCDLYLPHALACATLIEEYAFEFAAAARLLYRTAKYLDSRGQYIQAEPLHQRALAIREKQLGPEHPDTVSSLNDLAALYWHEGKYAEAEPLSQRTLAFMEKQLGQGHPDTAKFLNNLAALYDAQGKYEQAESLYQRALAITEKMPGSEPLRTAQTLNNLAELYRTQGKYEQAEPLYQRALAIHEQQLGPEHPDTEVSLNNLALLYSAQGKYEQAEPLHQRTLAITEKVLGPEHPDTARNLYNLATLYDVQGKYEQAEPLFQRALTIWEQQLGPDHPGPVRALNNLGLLYYNQGKYEQAEPFYQRALKIKEQQRGPENVDTAFTFYNLARLYRAQSKYDEAKPLIEHALAIFEQQLGSEHRYTVQARQELSKLQNYLESPETARTQEAIGEILAAGLKAILEALTRKRAALGVHVATVTPELTAQNNLSVDQGLHIESETPNGPAATAGLKPGDVIVQIDNTHVTDIKSLADMLLSKSSGDTVAVTVYRGSQQMTLDVQLGEVQEGS